MTPDTPFTPVSATGEFGLIDLLTEELGPPHDPDIVRTIGDDAAVYKIDDERVHVITTDILIESIHFDRSFMPMEYLGVKSIAVNVSDVIAMNALPRFATVALGVPHNVSVEMIQDIYRGIRKSCEAYGVTLIGGDTVASPKMTLSITVIGETKEENIIYRHGARIGDVLCVTGDLGASYAGLRLLLDQQSQLQQSGDGFKPVVNDFKYVIQRHLTPTPRLTTLKVFEESGVKPSAMIDISDGLASETQHICRLSHCGATLQASKLPIHEETQKVAQLLGQDTDTYALYGGEDYELLFTLSSDDLVKLPDGICTPIGTITEDESILVETPEGSLIPLQEKGINILAALQMQLPDSPQKLQ